MSPSNNFHKEYLSSNCFDTSIIRCRKLLPKLVANAYSIKENPDPDMLAKDFSFSLPSPEECENIIEDMDAKLFARHESQRKSEKGVQGM